MSVYTISGIILSEIQSCFDDVTCDYKYFVSVGEPPADCSTITAHHTGSVLNDRKAGTCLVTRRDSFEVMITRCCMKLSEEFDPAVEDENARCFYNDYDEILSCLVCGLGDALSAFSTNCKLLKVRSSSFDRAPMGGCFTGYIRIEIERFEGCCP